MVMFTTKLDESVNHLVCWMILLEIKVVLVQDKLKILNKFNKALSTLTKYVALIITMYYYVKTRTGIIFITT